MLRKILLIGLLSSALLGCESNHRVIPKDKCYFHSTVISCDIPEYINSDQIISFNPLTIKIENGNVLIFNTNYYLNCNTDEFTSIGN